MILKAAFPQNLLRQSICIVGQQSGLIQVAVIRLLKRELEFRICLVL